ncbi:Similarity (fragment) [Microcystis sp. T1-4]
MCVLAKGATINNRGINGSVPEWLMGADCKSVGYAYAGSNPARPTTINARVAQW